MFIELELGLLYKLEKVLVHAQIPDFWRTITTSSLREKP